jgi:hypothetical protein
MDKQQAKQILQNTGYIGNEVGVAFDVAIKSMDKLEKIEQIIERTEGTLGLDNYTVQQIKEVLENE